jgi:uncharacterized membrane protein
MALGKRIEGAFRSTRTRALGLLRTWFLTGVVVAAPISVTAWVVLSFISFVDNQVRPLVPLAWRPETYLDFALPGFGLVVAIIALTLLGALTANFLGKSVLKIGETLLDRVPIVRFIYRMVKQIFETFASSDSASFKEAVLIEYPRPGVWAVAFITNSQPGGEIGDKLPGVVAAFVPTSPNPATGYLIYVQPDQYRKLDMPVDKAMRLIISVGILGAGEIEGGALGVAAGAAPQA